ncbi:MULTISPECIES: S1 domain-containing RNA-binding protein [Pontibacillus]|uniref:S1 domain-containing RNA-binding protein n=1 Tax=Pontibacillus chungwhensis TaxID=265426 RepID=A0ABY8UXI8_9BACI|nr:MULTISPECIES: S1 domain-containing RNA-binding protein [Pontibacillus]MCD5326110.1 S1 domain-containing RNA-binding protein [Pontibacillus sp. HN14]WIF98209.1 S1 domain-containing RNA-binding protein [Pontibacillus chungwhensis]
MSIEVGSKLQGKVTGITNFGAFVELPNGSTGLVHISEVADNYVKDINDHLSEGDQVEVKVINVEKDGKIGLSIKKAKDNYKGDRERRSNNHNKGGGKGKGNKGNQRPENFDSLMNRFLKDSDEKLASLKKHTESKRGGRGAKRG